jgi:hypothetical protein
MRDMRETYRCTNWPEAVHAPAGGRPLGGRIHQGIGVLHCSHSRVIDVLGKRTDAQNTSTHTAGDREERDRGAREGNREEVREVKAASGTPGAGRQAVSDCNSVGHIPGKTRQALTC